MAIEQLELFQPTPDEINAKRIEEVFERSERVRKGAFAHIGEINKRLTRIEDMLEPLIAYICKMDKK